MTKQDVIDGGELGMNGVATVEEPSADLETKSWGVEAGSVTGWQLLTELR